MYQTLSAPINYQVELTTSCNHNCSHCYNFWRKDLKRVNTSLNKSTVSEIVEKMADAKVFDIIITGGEPLIKYDALLHCLKEAQNANLGVSLNSNLVLLTRTRARELRSLGVKQILTSLMGSLPEIHDKIAQSKGSFKKVVENSQIAQEEGIRVAVNMVVSKMNLSNIKETARIVSSIGVKMFSATKAGCPGNCSDFSQFSLSKSEFRQYLRDLRESGEEFDLAIDALEGYPLCGIGDLDYHYSFIGRRCYAGVTTMTIASDGEVRPCSHLDESYGNLFMEDLKKIWVRMETWRNGAFLPVICKSCTLSQVCGGGCRMEAKMRNGDLSSADPYSSPEDAERSFSSLQKHREKMPSKKPIKDFEIKSYRYRREPFGITVLAGKSRAFLNDAGFELLKQLEVGIRYSPGDKRIQWGTIDSDSFVDGIVRRGIAIEK